MARETPSAVYVLQTVDRDNPIYEGFAFEKFAWDIPSVLSRESLDEDILPDFGRDESKLEWSVASLKKHWKPQKVVGRVAPFNDYPTVHDTPVFSRRACDALKEFLQPNGELLPLVSDVGEYYLYHVTTVVDALDRTKSKCNYWPDDRFHCVNIDYFEFQPSRVADLSIFRIYERGEFTLVTEPFVERVQQCGFNGFNFLKVWPIPPTVNWRMQRHDVERAARRQIKAHTLGLILQLKKAKPDSAEKKQFKRLEDELDAQLTVAGLDAPYFGSYEGHDAVDREYRMFLSCPDVDVLEAKLEPWLTALGWPGRCYVVKRYGEMHDEDASEVSYEIG